MSNNIFPVNYIIDLPDLNLEMMQYYSKQWNLEHTKIQKGLFKGSLYAIHTPRIQLASAYYSQSFLSKGDFPNGCIVLIYAPHNVTYNFQNKIIQNNEIIVLEKGDEIDILTIGEIEVCTLVIEEKLFYETFFNYFDDTPKMIIKNKSFFIKPDMISVFNHTVYLWKTYLAKEYTLCNSKPPYETIEPEMLRQLFNCIISNPLKKMRKKFQTKKVRDLLHENIEQYINISDIASELDISEGQLHYTFRKEYGLSPKKYLQSLRFNAVKKDLLLAHPHTSTVMDIAQKYHFYHMGRFSKEYQNIFSQKPSETLHTKL